MDRSVGLDVHASGCTVAVVGPKSDRLDAFGLAEQLRIGTIKGNVYTKQGESGALKHRAWGLVAVMSVAVSVRVECVLNTGPTSPFTTPISSSTPLTRCVTPPEASFELLLRRGPPMPRPP